MVEHRAVSLDAVFHALADPHRRDILGALGAGPLSVGQLGEPLPISLAATSKHVRVLERAGLVRKQVAGRLRLCHLDAAALRAAHDWVGRYERFWSRRVDALEAALHADGVEMGGTG
jgi:DNA-binding transcriptional ArsR family regulator